MHEPWTGDDRTSREHSRRTNRHLNDYRSFSEKNHVTRLSISGSPPLLGWRSPQLWLVRCPGQTGTTTNAPQANFAAYASASSSSPTLSPAPVSPTRPSTWTDTTNGVSDYMIRRILNSTGVTAPTGTGTPAPASAQTPVDIFVPKGKFSVVDTTTVSGNSYDYYLMSNTKGTLATVGSPLTKFAVLAPTANAVVPVGRNVKDSTLWKDMTGGSWVVDTDGTFLQSDDNKDTPQTSKKLVRISPVIDNTSPSITTPATTATASSPAVPAFTSTTVQVTASVKLTGWDKLVNGANALNFVPQFRIGVGFTNQPNDWGGFFLLYGKGTGNKYTSFEDGKGNPLPSMTTPNFPAFKDGTKFMIKLRMENRAGMTHFSGKIWDPAGVQPTLWALETDGAAWPTVPAFTIQPTLYGGVQAAGDGRVTANFDDFLVEVFNSAPISTASASSPSLPLMRTVAPSLIAPDLDEAVDIPVVAVTPVAGTGQWGTLISRVDPEGPISVNPTNPSCSWVVPTASTKACCGRSAELLTSESPWSGTFSGMPLEGLATETALAPHEPIDGVPMQAVPEHGAPIIDGVPLEGPAIEGVIVGRRTTISPSPARPRTVSAGRPHEQAATRSIDRQPPVRRTAARVDLVKRTSYQPDQGPSPLPVENAPASTPVTATSAPVSATKPDPTLTLPQRTMSRRAVRDYGAVATAPDSTTDLVDSIIHKSLLNACMTNVKKKSLKRNANIDKDADAALDDAVYLLDEAIKTTKGLDTLRVIAARKDRSE